MKKENWFRIYVNGHPLVSVKCENTAVRALAYFRKDEENTYTIVPPANYKLKNEAEPVQLNDIINSDS